MSIEKPERFLKEERSDDFQSHSYLIAQKNTTQSGGIVFFTINFLSALHDNGVRTFPKTTGRERQ